jgi:hypothetical protein
MTMIQVYTMKPSSRVDSVQLKQQENMVLRGQKEMAACIGGKQPGVAQRRLKLFSQR